MASVIDELYVLMGLKTDAASFERGKEHVEGLAGMLTKFATAAVAALGIFEIGRTIGEVEELGEKAIRTSQKIGVGVEAIQELDYAAKFAGVSAEELENALGHLNRNLTEIAVGKGAEAADGLHLLGLRAEQLKGKTPDEALGTLSDAFAKMPDGAAKTTAAMDLFGRSGKDLIPLLDKGQAGIAGMRAEARKLGVVMSKETAEGMEEASAEQKKFGAAMTGLKITLVTALLPAVKRIVEAITDWVAAHREVIASAMQKIVEGLAIAFGIVGDVIDVVVDGFSALGDAGVTVGDVLIALGAIMLAFGAKAAVAWFLALGPIEAVILAIAAVAVGVALLIRKFDKIKAVGGRVWSWITDKAKEMWAELVKIANAIAAPFVAAFEWVKEKIGVVIDWIDDKIKWLKDKLDNGILGKITKAFGGAGAELSSEVLHKTGAFAPSVPGGAGGATTINVNAPQTVSIDAKNADAQQVYDIAQKAAKDHTQQQINEAFDAHRGGIR